MGYTPIPSEMQTEQVSKDLRTALWNILLSIITDLNFGLELWASYFEKPIDDFPYSTWTPHVKNYFFSSQWYELYDLIEFILQHYKPFSYENSLLIRDINAALESKLSAYRFINGQFTRVTDPQEIEALEEALQGSGFPGCRKHLQRALELWSDREHPDYRNSIKESISAVESIVRAITGNEKATLGQALKELEKSKSLHPALREAFSTLYGYTSDEGGIRHAMLDQPNVTADDAKLFLLLCTSFTNYLKAKFGNP